MISNKFQLILLTLLVIKIISDCPKDGRQFLVTFHPHLDAFWLDTDDDLKDINFKPAGFLYAMNQRNSKTIFNSMLEALTKNAIRKYLVTEVVFFKDWYEYLDQEKKKQVKKLFQKGQLEIANGGWVQNDQAVCYIDDIIDQYTIGHNFMDAVFNITTKIGWATDSFGHSHSQVAIQHLLGFQFQGIERIDDRYIYERNGGSLLEFYWSPVSHSNNRKYGGVVTYVRHFLHEVNDLRRDNPDSIARDFKMVETNMKSLYKTNKMFRFLGNDFEEFINDEFVALEKSYDILNSQNKNCPVYKYGNPTDYLDLVKNIYQDNAPVRQHDFMPNFDQDHYWAGYYTTNPQLKKVCKDFSRLVNLFRKIYIKYLSSGKEQNPNIRRILVLSDELLSVMQHHDGITATSKYHIEAMFITRMNSKTTDIINAISQLKSIPKQSCNLYQQGNTCQITSQQQRLYFSILHEGIHKKERIQLILPKNIAYDVVEDENDEIFCNPKGQICSLVFEAVLKSGENVFLLKKIDNSKNLNRIKVQGEQHKDNDFSISLKQGQITYIFNDEFIKISFVKSENRNSATSTYTWNKYGNKMEKSENKMSGIYIMANTGSISKFQFGIKNFQIIKGKIYTKIYFPAQENNIIITIKNTERNLIDLQTTFKPQNMQMQDYFIQIQSKINSKNEFYHDSNGYLVMKRKVGQRPDYKWQYKGEDKINANTYPMCSFAYAMDGEKKLVIFTDRAQGFTQYDNTYLINIDRLAGDDYKGVGQGFYKQIKNTFYHKIGIINKNQFIQRQWQRKFDEPLLGFYSNNQRSTSVNSLFNQNLNLLKYTIFSLNKDEYVIRFYNLGETTNINLPIHSATSWAIDQLDLNLKFADIKQSFANGLILSERKSWIKIDGEINMFNGGSKDSLAQIILSPLQIRSFRINTKNKIISKQNKSTNNILDLTLTDVTPIVKSFGKRCF